MADREVTIRATGGQIDEIVMALIDSAHDKDPGVRQTICTAIEQLGKSQAPLVLTSCHSFLVKHAKLVQSHRVIILKCMEAVVRESPEDIDQQLARSIIDQASAELTHSKEVIAEWQSAASGLLVALGSSFCNEVMEELQRKFQPGVLPHFFVVQTMANLATANVYGMVPFLKVVLGTMLPMLGLAKQDNMRWVFSAALSKFCEAILDYVANIEKAPDTSVRKEFFSAEIDSAYDIVFNVWLQSRETKLRVMIIEALGQMTHIMTKEKLEAELNRLLQAMIGLYRRHQNDPFHITQALCQVLGAAASISEDSSSLELHLDNLLTALFPQICQPVDYNNPGTVKNHNELLRCYTVLAGPFSEKLVSYLMQKLEMNNDKVRVATLSILRHLINSTSQLLDNKKQLIMAGLKVITSDPNNKVKKELAQTVMAMSHHGYLELEGGHIMIEFIIRQCCPHPEPQGRRPTDLDYVSNDALRAMCENVLQLMSTTVDIMDYVLWPYLLEFILPEQYTDAMAVVCRGVASLAQAKRDQQAIDSDIDFQAEVNLPKPPALIARMMVMCGRPTGGRNRGSNVLNAMKGLAPNMHKSVVELWDTVIPKMVQYFEDAVDDEEKWSLKNWEDLVLKMLSKTLEEIEDEEWTIDLGEAFGQQLPMYANSPEEKNFAFKALGIIMRKSAKNDFVSKHLDLIFSCVKHGNDIEREGCAVAMGYVATSHLDTVLAKLDCIIRNETGKRSSGIFGFIKDSVSKSEVDEKTKATVVLCYGYVTLQAPPSLIKSRLETSILKAITPHYAVVKDLALKHSVIKTTDLIGRAMHPEHLLCNHVFTQRAELLTFMQNYLRLESPSALNSDLRALTLEASSTLVKLDPPPSELEVFELVKASLDAVMALPPGGTASGKVKEESYQDHIHQEKLMASTMRALGGLQNTLLLRDVTPNGLESIFKHLHPWMLSQHEHERERAVTLCLKLFNLYLDQVKVVVGSSSHFSNLGSLLGRLIPRCTDPCLSVRQTALDSLQALLRIALRYQGHGPEYSDKMVEAIPTLKEGVKKNDPSVLFNVSKDIASVLSKLMPGDQLMPCLHELYEGLTDPHDQSSSGACVVLNSIVKSRGAALPTEVEAILVALHEKLPEILCQQTQTGTLRTIRSIASHHLLTTLTTLLNADLPFDEYLLACWRVIGEERALLPSIFSHLLDVLMRTLPYDERPDPRGKDRSERTATRLPVAVTCALKELFVVEEARGQVQENYSRLLAAVMLRVASTVGVNPPKPSKVEKSTSGKMRDKKSPHTSTSSHTKKGLIDPCSMSVDTLRAFLLMSNSVDILESLTEEDIWGKFTLEDAYPEAFTTLARLVVRHQPGHIASLITVLNPALGSVYEPQRVMTAAVFAELINQKCAGDLALVEMLVNSLLGRLVDTSHSVRRLCIRGLGNVASVGSEQVQRHSTTVLSAMMAGMDDKEDLEDSITLEAMSGLSRILEQIDEAHIRAILINIALRIRPCFEKDKADVRAAAFTLFGNLSYFGDGPSKTPFLEQIQTNFVSLLLHLNDPDKEVRKACKFALRLLGPLIGSETMDKMFQRHLLEDGTLHYGEFMNDLSKVMIQDFPDKLNFYVMGNVTFFKSSWPQIQSNAAMFVGFLLGNATKDLYGEVSKEHVLSALVILLKDHSPEVRTKAAEAMSKLHNF